MDDADRAMSLTLDETLRRSTWLCADRSSSPGAVMDSLRHIDRDDPDVLNESARELILRLHALCDAMAIIIAAFT